MEIQVLFSCFEIIDCRKHNVPCDWCCDWFVWLKIQNKVVCKTVKVRVLVASNDDIFCCSHKNDKSIYSCKPSKTTANESVELKVKELTLKNILKKYNLSIDDIYLFLVYSIMFFESYKILNERQITTGEKSSLTPLFCQFLFEYVIKDELYKFYTEFCGQGEDIKNNISKTFGFSCILQNVLQNMFRYINVVIMAIIKNGKNVHLGLQTAGILMNSMYMVSPSETLDYIKKIQKKELLL